MMRAKVWPRWDNIDNPTDNIKTHEWYAYGRTPVVPDGVVFEEPTADELTAESLTETVGPVVADSDVLQETATRKGKGKWKGKERERDVEMDIEMVGETPAMKGTQTSFV